MMHKIKRLTANISVIALLVGLPSAVSGQDISKEEEERSSAVSAQTRKEVADRIEKQGEEIEKEEKKKKGPKARPDMSLKQYKDQGRKLSPEELERLEKKIQRKNKRMIDKLNRIIERDPYSDKRPNWMFQKAELMWEVQNKKYMRKRAEYNQCMTAKDQGTAKSCQEPSPDYSDAREIYREILRKYPEYSRLDEVLYRLGSGLIEADKVPEGVAKLNRLVEEYPNSKYIPNAHLALAETFFNKEQLGLARDNYKAVLDYKDDPNYDYALYKLGWVYYNRQEYETSIDTFQTVVKRADEKLGFQKQALNDMVVGYSEVENGWQRARDYFTKVKDKQFAYGQLADLASLYEGQGKNRLAIQVYEYFLDERGDHKKVPFWMENIIAARKNMEQLEQLEKDINRFAAYLRPDGSWATQNEGNEKSLKKARELVKSSIAYLANKYHRLAQEQKDKSKQNYLSAAKYYKKYINRFPKDPASFDMNFFLGDIYLLKIDSYQKAAKYYQKVVDLYKADKVPEKAKKKDVEAMVKDAAFGVVNSYNELVKKHHKDSILVKMAKYEEKHGGKEYRAEDYQKGTDKKPNPKVDLLKWEKKFVEAADQYSEMYPDTDVTPTIDYVAAEVYKARGHYDKCVPRYENIIKNAGDHRYASFAGNSLLVANYRLENWKEVEKWARYLMDNKIFDVTPKESLQQSIAYAINEQAKKLQEQDKVEKASKRLLQLAEEFPESDLAPGALFNAAAIYESGDQVNKAVKLYQRVIDEYPENEKVPDAFFVLGAIFESRANFDKAADYFARLGSDEYKDHKRAADAVYNAAVLREAMESWQEAIDAYSKYVELYPDRDNVKDVKLKLAYLEKNQKDWEKALERFKTYLDLDDVDQPKRIEVHVQIGNLVERLEKGDEWEKEAKKHFKKAFKSWEKLEDKKAKKKARRYAAEAKFRRSEQIFREFKQVALEFPMDQLKDRMNEKAELEQKAEKMYSKVIEMKSPRWVAASAYRIGQMYQDFSEQLYDLPLPKGLNQRQKTQYRMTLDKRAMPLEEKALKAFETALKLALKYQAYNEWSSKSARQISELKSQAYPITQQKDVESTHGRIDFYTPGAVTDLDSVVDRAQKRIERREKKRKKKKKKEDKKKKQKEEQTPQAMQ